MTGVLLALAPFASKASPEITIEQVTDSVYALVGDLGNRSTENLGNNATFGVIVTPEGVVLVDPGGTREGARRIHERIREITDQPVVTVINTGGQDHRWLGNGYFKSLGATIIASTDAVEDQKNRGRDQYNMLAVLVGEELVRGTEYVHADRVFSDRLAIDVGGTPIEIIHQGGAHTPGDSFVWLPRESVLFTGDIVYTERMLGVIDVSNSRNWLKVFDAIAAYAPVHVVPGHGSPTDLDKARQDTYDYLVYLRQAVRELMDSGGDISEISTIDQERFRYLANFEELAGRNAQRVFSEMEWE